MIIMEISETSPAVIPEPCNLPTTSSRQSQNYLGCLLFLFPCAKQQILQHPTILQHFSATLSPGAIGEALGLLSLRHSEMENHGPTRGHLTRGVIFRWIF